MGASKNKFTAEREADELRQSYEELMEFRSNMAQHIDNFFHTLGSVKTWENDALLTALRDKVEYKADGLLFGDMFSAEVEDDDYIICVSGSVEERNGEVFYYLSSIKVYDEDREIKTLGGEIYEVEEFINN
jgi:hypothetical protein